jgi:hypothetical protein|tara:strand:- start:1132 stop:1446 length:315 start_codon:yes stop_codon:yes gene_type:complete
MEKLNMENEYSYEHLVQTCDVSKKDRETYFNFLIKFFEITGDCDDFHEKNLFNKETKRIANMVSTLSDTIKGELWRELERQSLDVIYEKEILEINRNVNCEIIS